MTTTDHILPTTLPGTPPAGAAGVAHPKAPEHSHTLFGDDGLTFRDVLDMINPLQHLPVISTLYRSLVDDELSPGARMIGGGLFGGFIGLGIAMLNSVIEDLTGKDVGAHVVALFSRPDGPPGTPETPAKVMVAAAPVSSTPLEEPKPVPPRPIIPVHREELPPPLMHAALKPIAPPPAPDSTPAVRPSRAHHDHGVRRAQRESRPIYNMNTELINLLMFSVPVRVGPGAREPSAENQHSQPRPGPQTGHTSDHTSSLPHDHGAARMAANQAYRHGAAARASAIAHAGAWFTPLAGSGSL